MLRFYFYSFTPPTQCALGTWALSPVPPFSTLRKCLAPSLPSSRPPSLPPWGRGSRAMACLQRVYEVSPSPSSLDMLFPARHLPCFLGLPTMGYTLSAAALLPSLCLGLHVHSDKGRISGCPRVATAFVEVSLSRTAEPPLPQGPQASQRGQELSFAAVCVTARYSTSNPGIHSFIHSPTSSFQYIY